MASFCIALPIQAVKSRSRLAQDRAAGSHLFNNMRPVMVIDEFRAAKGGRCPAKKGFDFPFMPQDLLYEFSMFPEKGV